MATEPPILYDELAERALVGAGLLDNSLFLNTLSDSDFAVYGSLWAACRDLVRRGLHPDPVTLKSVWPVNTSYSSFTDACTSVVFAHDYANVIRGFSRKRKLEAAAGLFTRAAYDDARRAEYLQDAYNLLREAETDGDGWQVLTMRDAYAPREPVQYAVAGLIEKPSLNIFYGAPGTLKSLLLADLAVCVAGGYNWLPGSLAECVESNDPLNAIFGFLGESEKQPGGVDPFKTTQTPVLWLDFDNGKRRTSERFAALAKSRRLPEDAPFSYVSMPSPWLNAGNEESADRLLQLVKRLDAGMVIVDNLGVVTDCDENSADMANVMAAFRRIAEDTGAAVILVHHQRKTNGSGARLGETPRGHSSIEAALDLALLVQRSEDDPEAVTVVCTKARGVSVPTFGARFEYTQNAYKELAAAHFLGTRIETKTGLTNKAILAAVEAQPGINKSDLVDTVKNETGAGINFIRDAIQWLVDNERLVASDGPKNSKLYTCQVECFSFTVFYSEG